LLGVIGRDYEKMTGSIRGIMGYLSQKCHHLIPSIGTGLIGGVSSR